MFWILLVRFSHFVYIVRNLLVRIAECLCVCAEFISANFTLIRTNKFRTFLFRTILFSHFLIPLRYCIVTYVTCFNCIVAVVHASIMLLCLFNGVN